MKKSKIISLGVAGLILTSTVFAMTYRTFTATERPDFTIVMDGEVQKFRDANGNEFHPMIINGSTYLPLKATAGLFGKDVSWDAVTGTATIGEKVAVERSLFDVAKITHSDGAYATAVRGEQNLTFDIGDVGVSYKEAIKITSYTRHFDVKLNGDYDKLSLTLLPIGGGPANFRIIDMDTGIDILNKEVDSEEICEIKDLDIKNIKNISFEYDRRNIGASSPTVYFLNPTVK